MTDLEDVFGEDLAQNVREKTAERRQERNSVSEEQMAKICYTSVHEDKFGEGEPMFTYTTDNNISHTVILMSVPELENGTVWEYLDEPWEGAASLPLDYLGEWMRCTFPDKDMLKKIDAGDTVLIVGEIDEYEKDNGEVVESVYPVRGLATLDEVKKYAEEGYDNEDFADEEEESEEETSTPEPEPEEESEEEEVEDTTEEESSSDEEGEDSSDGGLDGLLNEDEDDEEEEEEEEEPVPYDDIANLVEELGEQEEEVWEVTEGDERLDKLTKVVVKKLDSLEAENAEATQEVILDVVEEHRNSEEGEEDEDIKNRLFE